MNTLYHAVLAALSITLLLVGSSEARIVYLKDGALLQAEAAWRSDSKVIVQVNHEAEVTFSEGEVNLKKTFPKHDVRKKSPHRVKQTARVSVMSGMSTAQAPGAGQIPASKPATSAKKDSAGPAAALPVGQTPPSGKGSPPATVKSGEPSTASTAAKPGQLASATAPKPPETAVQPPTAAKVPTPPPQPATSVTTPPPVKLPLPGAAAALKKFPVVSQAALFSIVAGVLLLVVLMIVSLWKVYEKAGQAGWKSLIPIYNYVVFLNMIDKPVWWVILLFVPLVSVVILIIMHIELAKRFGKGVLYGLGLCFFPIIFFPLLAFSDATYA